MQDREPTIRSRELGDGLRHAMEIARINGKDLADRLGWTPTKVSRLLTGRRGAEEMEVAEFLAVCGIKGRERRRLLALCREQDTQSWFQQFGSRVPMDIKTYVDLENKATSITDFQASVLPGILQIDDYARALLTRNANVPAGEVEQRVAARAARRIIFRRSDRPKCSFFIHEFALRLSAGDREVMSEQLHHLIRMSVRSCITIRVIPAASGIHAGMAGAFTLLESPENQSVVYLEGETSGLFLEKADEVAAYRRVLESLVAVALGEGESKELIAEVAIDLYGEDRHAGLAEELL